MAKKEKTIRITPAVISRMSRLKGLEFSPTDLQRAVDEPTVDDSIGSDPTFVEGCVDWLHYAETSTELTSVRLFYNKIFLDIDVALEATAGAAYRRSDGILVQNLNDYRSQFEHAANFGKVVFVEIVAGKIRHFISIRCACPCDEGHASGIPEDRDIPGGIADGVNTL